YAFNRHRSAPTSTGYPNTFGLTSTLIPFFRVDYLEPHFRFLSVSFLCSGQIHGRKREKKIQVLYKK
ncbi:MAG: hypothetical protein ACRC4G_04555, partial [Alphaproteobacteria bacterium]